jgi:hypothetical protein
MTVKVLLIVNPAEVVIPAKAGIQIFLFANRYLFLVVENNLHIGLPTYLQLMTQPWGENIVYLN